MNEYTIKAVGDEYDVVFTNGVVAPYRAFNYEDALNYIKELSKTIGVKKSVTSMSDEMRLLKQNAEIAKRLYAVNLMTRDEAKEKIMPYINEVNKRGAELAKEYNQKPRLVNFSGYCR